MNQFKIETEKQKEATDKQSVKDTIAELQKQGVPEAQILDITRAAFSIGNDKRVDQIPL